MTASGDIRKTKGVLPDLKKAKKMSDEGNYTSKANIIRRLMEQDPDAWVVDSREGNKHPGVTHLPTGFRFHLPNKVITPAVQNKKPEMEKSAFIKLSANRFTKVFNKLWKAEKLAERTPGMYDRRASHMGRALKNNGIIDKFDRPTGKITRSPFVDMRDKPVIPFQYKGKSLQDRIAMAEEQSFRLQGLGKHVATERARMNQNVPFSDRLHGRSPSSLLLNKPLVRPEGRDWVDSKYDMVANVVTTPKPGRGSLIFRSPYITRHELGHANSANYGAINRGYFDLKDRLMVKRLEDHSPGIIGKVDDAIGRNRLIEEGTVEHMAHYRDRFGRMPSSVPMPGKHLMMGRGKDKQLQKVVDHLHANYMAPGYRGGLGGVRDRVVTGARRLPSYYAVLSRVLRGVPID